MDCRIDIALLRRDLGMKQAEFACELGIKQPYLSEIENGKKPITDELYERIKQKWGINTCDKYAITSQTSSFPVREQDFPREESRTATFVKLIPVAAQGGSLTDFIYSVKESDCELLASPIRDVDFAVQVSGDSMAPEYPNGSHVYVKRINERAFIEWGKVYVLDTCNGSVIKILVPSEREGYVRCLSINNDPKFAPFEVSMNDIRGVYRVLLCMSLK